YCTPAQDRRNKRQQPAGHLPLADVVCNREGRAGRTEGADNGARAINRILLASVSGSGALVESGKASGTHEALRTKLGGTEVD
ncbi:hypothetical protein, partial [Klebsiella aerogenes]|uniref:hypothetical protein n=1 Tax=Klebsiella aerogenes TaxID=548 RepID=UPI001953CBA1